MKHFKRRKCALCGRRATVKIIGRPTNSRYRKLWSCKIYCLHCKKCTAGRITTDKELAKTTAVQIWNANQGRNLLAMERFLRKIFAGGERE